MKIKTLKIKVTADNQEFDFNEFFTGSNTIYNTNAQLIQEKDGLYWHAFITYEPQNSYNNYKKEKPTLPEIEIPKVYKEELYALMNDTKNISVRAKNAVRGNFELIYSFNKMHDFKKIRSLGSKTLQENEAFFNTVLAIAIKHQALATQTNA